MLGTIQQNNLISFKTVPQRINAFFFITLCALIFVMPLARTLPPYFIIILAVSLFFIPGRNSKLKALKTHYPQIILFSLLYIIYLISFFYSEDRDIAKTKLILKLPLLLFPFIFSFTSDIITRHQVKVLLYVFILSCFSGSLYLLIQALLQYSATGSYWLIVYSNFSLFFHPTYYGVFINWSIALILFFMTREKPHQKKFFLKTALYFFLAFYFIAIVVLLNSKAVFISTFIVVVIWLFHGFLIRKAYRSTSLFLIITAVVFFAAAKQFPEVFIRISDAAVNFTNKSYHEEDYAGTYLRFEIWQTSTEVIQKRIWTGVGIGDVNHALHEKYEKTHRYSLSESRFNAHNQFLQVFVAAGVFGFAALLILLILPFEKIKRQHPYFLLLLFFTAIITINFMAESMMERQAGLLFYSFFAAFFTFMVSKKNTSF